MTITNYMSLVLRVTDWSEYYHGLLNPSSTSQEQSAMTCSSLVPVSHNHSIPECI